MIILRVNPGYPVAEGFTAIKLIATRFAGSHRLRIDAGQHTLLLGDAWLYSASEPCLAALRDFGDVDVVIDPRSSAPGAAPDGEHERPDRRP